MKITETSGNSKNGIRGQRISVYADVDGKRYLIDRFSVTSKYGALNYCRAHEGKYSKMFSTAIETAEKVEESKNVKNYREVDSRYRTN